MELGSLGIATVAMVVSLVSFYFSRKSWKASNRPLVTARVTSFGMAGNVAILLSLLVENTGNRPAKNIQLSVEAETLDPLFVADESHTLRKQVETCFSDEGIIPILANGKSISNSFGMLSDDHNCTWRGRVRFDIQVFYQDLDGREFHHTNPLFTADDSGFAGGFWSRSDNTKASKSSTT